VLRIIFTLLLLAVPAFAEPIEPGAIEVIDGDTIRAYGVAVVRLVGFDTPETGYHARCESGGVAPLADAPCWRRIRLDRRGVLVRGRNAGHAAMQLRPRLRRTHGAGQGRC
jgi:hypothetical protein